MCNGICQFCTNTVKTWAPRIHLLGFISHFSWESCPLFVPLPMSAFIARGPKIQLYTHRAAIRVQGTLSQVPGLQRDFSISQINDLTHLSSTASCKRQGRRQHERGKLCNLSQASPTCLGIEGCVCKCFLHTVADPAEVVALATAPILEGPAGKMREKILPPGIFNLWFLSWDKGATLLSKLLA